MSSQASNQKMCPLLTLATIKPPDQSRVLPLSGAKAPVDEGFSAVPCTGPMCMFFQPVVDENKRMVGGNCSVALIPAALSMLNTSVREAAALNTKKEGN